MLDSPLFAFLPAPGIGVCLKISIMSNNQTAFKSYLEDTAQEGVPSLLRLKSDVNEVFMTHVLLHDDNSEWSQEYRERIHILWFSIQDMIDFYALKLAGQS